ncbi:ubiquitin carboxyl-terminal hydrolase 2-like [Phragmites australis]|uniref:ubiquitin carboxyl-terminal hydrolase 2-like n=1 Tax=Phragmites australis TaxID=29695 RepID=UPI002D79B5E6|nr:ubiquitin carboxyl-terminal hydrolase 2-like [Phragmites australis]
MRMLSSERAGRCELCRRPIAGSSILVCLECGRHFCSGVGALEYPFGHSRYHAKQEQHWVAALSDDPESAFCFKCDYVVVGVTPPDAVEMMDKAEAGDHAFGSTDSHELSAAAAADSGCDEDGWPERCTHVRTDSAHLKMLSASLLSERAGRCERCKHPVEGSSILVCMECGRHFCTGVGSGDDPVGHSRQHAKQEQHWVAALYDEPESAYCFKCEYVVCVIPDEVEMMDKVEAGGHAFEFKPAYGHGYAIRGIPNIGNTCYLNAMVQCLLVLDKLRARMLGPDAPKGLLAMALTELFVVTSAAGDILDPTKLLTCVCWYNETFKGGGMHDSQELLCSLRNCLNEDEEKYKNLHGQSGAPTVINSIFGFELSETRTCKCRLSNSVSHAFFYDLPLALPSKGHPAKSAASPQTSGSLKSQPKKIAIQVFPANEQSNSEKIQTVAERGDSHLLGSELKDVVVEETPEPLEVGEFMCSCTYSKALTADVGVLEKKATLNAEDKDPKKYVEDDSCWLHDVATADKFKHYMLGSADSTEVQRICQSKDVVVQGPLQTQEDKDLCSELSRRIIKVPVKSVSFLPHNVSDVKVEEMDKKTADSIGSIEDCLSLFFEEVIEWRCDNCSKVYKELSTNQSENGEQIVASTNENTTFDGDQAEQSDRTTCQNEQSNGSNSLSVECKSSSSRQPHGSDAQSQIVQIVDIITEGTNLGMSCGEKDSAACSTADKEPECHEGILEAVSSCLPDEKQTNLYQDRTKQIGPDHSAYLLKDDRNEQKDRNGDAIQTRLFNKLPPVLTLHLKRTDNLQRKISEHVKYKEYLDVGPFIDPSSVDKDNSIYRLVGVVEHRGTGSLNTGHYVAYVRARRLGNHQQQSSCSHSWFRADDSVITEVSLEDVLKRQAYVLFYERMEDMSGIRSHN